MLKAERPPEQDQLPSLTPGQPIGHVVSVRGSQATIGLLAQGSSMRETVGKFLGIRTTRELLAPLAEAAHFFDAGPSASHLE